LVDQWNKYINPLNHLFFFVSGLLIGFFYKKYKLKQIYVCILLIIMGMFMAYYPLKYGEGIELVTNWNRLILSLICIAFTYFFTQINIPSNFISNKLKTLGEISYSVYLVHPLVYFASSNFFVFMANYTEIQPIYKVIILVITSLIVSWFIFFNFEKKFIELGNKFVQKR
jgi:exopolysaccharide production protein ExoZ